MKVGAELAGKGRVVDRGGRKIRRWGVSNQNALDPCTKLPKNNVFKKGRKRKASN